jgi:tetratricopeptide (TPR) repeat protein
MKEATALDRAAREALARADPAEALRLWSQALDLLEAAGDLRAMAAVLHAMAETCAAREQFGRALDFWQRALNLTERLGDAANQGLILTSMAVARGMSDDLPGGMACATRAIPLLEHAGDLRALLAALDVAGRLAARVAPATADVVLERMIEVADAVGEKQLKGEALDGLGSWHASAERWAAAEELFERAYDTFRSAGNLRSAAIELANVDEARFKQGKPARHHREDDRPAVIYREAKVVEAQGDVARAVQLMKVVRDVCARSGDPSGVGAANIELGRFAQLAEDWSEAAAFWEQAVQALTGPEALQARQNSLYLQAHALARAGDPERSLAVLEEATRVDLARGVPPDDAADMLDDIAAALVRRGDSARGIALWERALEGCARAGNAPYRAKILAQLGEVLAVRGNVPRALAAIDEALQIFSEGGFVQHQATVLAKRGNIVAQTGQDQIAIGCWRAAADLQLKVGDDRGRGVSLENVANALVRSGRRADAVPFYQQALAIFEKVEDEESKQRVLQHMSTAGSTTN